MTSINTIIELSEVCKEHNIKMGIDESGIMLSALKHGKEISKNYDLETINIIALSYPVQIIIDMFIEEYVLQFKKAAC